MLSSPKEKIYSFDTSITFKIYKLCHIFWNEKFQVVHNNRYYMAPPIHMNKAVHLSGILTKINISLIPIRQP